VTNDRSHHRPGGGFRNPWPDSAPRPFTDLLRWTMDRWRDPPPPAPDPSVFPRATPAPARPRGAPDELRVTWVGHSTVLLQAGGINALTDPMWSERASPLSFAGPKRVVPPALSFDALPPIDVVLLSHNHYDHLDRPTVERLARSQPQARWVAPLGLAPTLRAWGVRDAMEHDWWDEATLATPAGDAIVGCTPAQHFSARGPHDRDATLWCGWTLRAGRWRVYFAGDTGLHPEFGAIAARWGPFDLALLPVGAYEPRWFMRPVHMNPDDALDAYAALRDAHAEASAPAMLPIHWGTFKLTDEEMREPAARTRAGWEARGWTRERLWLLAHGETRALR
jgi:N-acyl-phosphatidylethanolamine-hydrolysing phospholipase D